MHQQLNSVDHLVQVAVNCGAHKSSTRKLT